MTDEEIAIAELRQDLEDLEERVAIRALQVDHEALWQRVVKLESRVAEHGDRLEGHWDELVVIKREVLSLKGSVGRLEASATAQSTMLEKVLDIVSGLRDERAKDASEAAAIIRKTHDLLENLRPVIERHRG